MVKKIFKIASFTLPIFIGLFLIFYSFSKLSDTDYLKIKMSFQTANYGWVIVSCILGVLSHLSRAYRWNYLLQPLGYRIGFLNSIFSIFSAYLLNLFVPRSGEVARATIAQTYEEIPASKAFGTIVVERVFDTLILGSIILTAFYLQTDLIEQYLFKKESNSVKWIVLLLGGLFLVIGYLFIRNSKHPIALKITRFIAGIIEGLKSIFSMKKKHWFILHTLFIWAMYLLMFYTVTLAFPEMENLPKSSIIIGFVVGALSMALTNGGLGTYPVLVAEAFVLYGISDGVAIAFGWTMWTAQTLLILLLGGLSMILLPIYNRGEK